MPEQKNKPESNNPISFRPSIEARRQLEDLMELWNENQTQALIRMIERIWLMEVSPGRMVTEGRQRQSGKARD